MLNFKQVNVNPKGRKTGDCSTRALAYVLDISWEEALKLQCEESLKTKYDPTSRKVVEKVLAKYGYSKQKQPRTLDGYKYPICKLDRCISRAERNNKIVCNVANHYVVIDGDSYVDSWDSGDRVCGNYYSKKQ